MCVVINNPTRVCERFNPITSYPSKDAGSVSIRPSVRTGVCRRKHHTPCRTHRSHASRKLIDGARAEGTLVAARSHKDRGWKITRAREATTTRSIACLLRYPHSPPPPRWPKHDPTTRRCCSHEIGFLRLTARMMVASQAPALGRVLLRRHGLRLRLAQPCTRFPLRVPPPPPPPLVQL